MQNHSKVWGEQVIYLLIMLLFFKDALKCSIMTFIMLQKRLFKQMLLNFLYLKHLWKKKCTHKNMKQQKLFILIRDINNYYAILSSSGTMLWQYPKLLRNNIENIIFVTFLIHYFKQKHVMPEWSGLVHPMMHCFGQILIDKHRITVNSKAESPFIPDHTGVFSLLLQGDVEEPHLCFPEHDAVLQLGDLRARSLIVPCDVVRCFCRIKEIIDLQRALQYRHFTRDGERPLKRLSEVPAGTCSHTYVMKS